MSSSGLPSLVGRTSNGYPIRVGAKLCPWFAKYKYCAKRDTCPYTHSEIAETKKSSDMEITVHTPTSLEIDFVQELNEWLEKKYGGSTLMSKIRSEFLFERPEFEPVFTMNRMYPTLQKFSKFFWMDKPSGTTIIQTMDYRMRNNLTSNEEPHGESAVPRRKQQPLTSEEGFLIADTVKASDPKSSVSLIIPRQVALDFAQWMLDTDIDLISGKDLLPFYNKYREHKGAFHNKWSLLLKDHGDIFAAGPYDSVRLRNKNLPVIWKEASHMDVAIGMNKIEDRTYHPEVSKVSSEGLANKSKVDVSFLRAALDLDKYISSMHNGDLPAVEISAFYRKFPEHKSTLKGRTKELVSSLPDMFKISGIPPRITLHVPVSKHWNKIEPSTISNPASQPILHQVTSDVAAAKDTDQTLELEQQPILLTMLPVFPSLKIEDDVKILKEKADSPLSLPSTNSFPVVCTHNARDMLETLKSWVPFDCIGIDIGVDASSNHIINVQIINEELRIVAFSCPGSKLEDELWSSGLADVMQDEDVVKVCHTSNHIAASLFRSAGIPLRRVFDLRAAGAILLPDVDASECSLLGLTSHFGLVANSYVSTLRSPLIWNTPNPSFWLNWCKFLLVTQMQLYRVMFQLAKEKNLLQACFQHSQVEVIKGISYAQLVGPLLNPYSSAEHVPTSAAKLAPGMQTKRTIPIKCMWFYGKTPGKCPHGKRCFYIH